MLSTVGLHVILHYLMGFLDVTDFMSILCALKRNPV